MPVPDSLQSVFLCEARQSPLSGDLVIRLGLTTYPVRRYDAATWVFLVGKRARDLGP